MIIEDTRTSRVSIKLTWSEVWAIIAEHHGVQIPDMEEVNDRYVLEQYNLQTDTLIRRVYLGGEDTHGVVLRLVDSEDCLTPADEPKSEEASPYPEAFFSV